MSEEISSYVRLQKHLLNLERDEERLETSQAFSGAKLATLESAGLALTRLALHAQISDLGGRQRLTFRPRAANRRLSATRISTGDIVAVRPQPLPAPSPQVTEGVVTALDESSITVCVDEAPHYEGDPSTSFLLLKQSPDVTHRRYANALSSLEGASSDSTHVSYSLLGVLFHSHAPRFQDHVEDIAAATLSGLNERQADAVRLALRAKELAVIHGPPGTGKTHTIVAYIISEVARGNRVLVAAPSNVAVDNIAERLASYNTTLRFIRAGHPARIIPSVQPFSMDAVLARTEQASLARDVRAELDSVEVRVLKTRDRGVRKALRLEQRVLRKELRKREALAVRRLLANMDVVLTTISGAGARVLDIAEQSVSFDVVVIDEAAQALEAACWVPLLRARKAVLAGDPFQLAGTVKSTAAEVGGLKKSILDRIFAKGHLQKAVIMLEKQYRMNSVISTWSSDEFYDGKLSADDGVADRLVADLETCSADVDDNANLVNPFIVIDTAGGDCEEEALSKEIEDDPSARSCSAAIASRSNSGEAQIMCRVVDEFIACGVRKEDLAVISPYSGQVEFLRNSIWPRHGKGLEIATIDSFQGREKEIVCMSLVRSNEQGDVGFLSDDRRLNVAITRARRCVVIICDSETVSRHPLLSRMIEYAEMFGLYRSAVVDFPDIVGTFSSQRRPREAIAAEQRSGASRKGVPKRKTSRNVQRKDGITDKQESSDVKVHKGRIKISPPLPHIADLQVQVQVRDEIQDFISDGLAMEKEFSPDLSSLGRKMVHELAEEFRIGHETTQVGDSRRIRIWKSEGERREEGLTPSCNELDKTTERGVYAGTRASVAYERFVEKDDEVKITAVPCESLVESIDASDKTPKSVSQLTSTYKDINSLLREVSISREERKLPLVLEKDGASASLDAQTVEPKKKRHRKGRKKSVHSDEEFDAVLVKYGAGHDKSGRKLDLVEQIMQGHHRPEPRPRRVNVEAKQRLAAKLAKESEKRTRKTKK